MFSKKSSGNYKEPAAGIKMKTITHGEKTSMVEFYLTGGTFMEVHSHPHEQTGYVISGKLILIVDGQPNPAGPGDSWTVAGDVPHSAEIIEDAHVIEVFTPVREDLLLKRGQSGNRFDRSRRAKARFCPPHERIRAGRALWARLEWVVIREC